MFELSLPSHVTLQPFGPGKYVFDIGCEQHGEYRQVEQVIQHKHNPTVSAYSVVAMYVLKLLKVIWKTVHFADAMNEYHKQ